MSLGEMIGDMMPMFRENAESLMSDAVRIESLTGASELVAGKEVPVRVLVYEGKGRFQSFEPYEQTPSVPGGEVTVQRNGLSIPVAVGPAKIGHIVTCLSSAMDPYMAGREYRVASLLHKTHATAQRLVLTEEM